jgi:hypothetical protein
MGMMQSTIASTAVQFGLVDKSKSSSRRSKYMMQKSRLMHFERSKSCYEANRHDEGQQMPDTNDPQDEIAAQDEPHSADYTRNVHSLPEEALRKELLRRRKLSRQGSSSTAGVSVRTATGTSSMSLDSHAESSHRPDMLDMEWICLPYYFLQGLCELTVGARTSALRRQRCTLMRVRASADLDIPRP